MFKASSRVVWIFVKKRVAVLVGSWRRESINLKLAMTIRELAKEYCICELVSLASLPMYNDDLWPNVPPSVTKFKADLALADAVLFIN